MTTNHNTGEPNALDRENPPRADGEFARPSEQLNPPRRTAWQKFKLIFKVVEIRLRFIVLLIFVFLYVGYWDTITNHWEKQTRSDGDVYNVVRMVLGNRAAHWMWPQAQACARPFGYRVLLPDAPERGAADA